MEFAARRMVSYCKANGLVLNGLKTQIVTLAQTNMEIKIGQEHVPVSQQIKLLGVDYDSNFSTLPYLKILERDAKTRADIIKRLSFCMPQFLLKPITHGILLGKIFAHTPS